MGKESTLKTLRKQLRNVVKEEMGTIVTNELYLKAQEQNKETLKLIQEMVSAKLTEIDNRSKDVQSMIIREMAANRPAVTPAVEPNVSE